MPISLPTKPYLTMDAVRAIADAAIAEATKQNLRMAIAIVDTGGHLLYFTRMSELIAPGAADSCLSKAQSAAMFTRATLAWEEAAKDRPVIMKIPNVMPLGGGVPLTVNGVAVGAIGVGGATSAKDDEIARAGAAALG